MICVKAGFVYPYTKEIAHTVTGFHCIIHEEASCAEAGLKALQDVMQTVTKVVSSISGRALHTKQFQILLIEVIFVHIGLKMYNNARWLSRGFVLKRFDERDIALLEWPMMLHTTNCLMKTGFLN